MSSATRLPDKARDVIEAGDGKIFASAVNAFEIALKHRLGKLEVATALLRNYEADLAQVGLFELQVTTRHALAAGALETLHRDPFDRLLIAQAKVENLTLISNETLFDRCGVRRLWD
jgi:PIN domain nuclease of toxin-antitoxin system